MADEHAIPWSRTVAVWPAFYEASPVDWRSAIALMVEHYMSESPAYINLLRDFEALAEQLPHEMSNALDDALCDIRAYLISVGAVLGFSLARTQPKNIEGWDTWLSRAVAYGAADQPIRTGAQLGHDVLTPVVSGWAAVQAAETAPTLRRSEIMAEIDAEVARRMEELIGDFRMRSGRLIDEVAQLIEQRQELVS